MAEKVVLVLQGGGALGAYQAGAYCALHDEGIEPDWVAGISIGAINSAIIAGNAPSERAPQLRKFWNLVSSNLLLPKLSNTAAGRTLQNNLSANWVASFGVPGFFKPQNPLHALQGWLAGHSQALGVYDTSPLKHTLQELVDFERLNHPSVRFSVGAVNVETGNFVYFDNTQITIEPEHIMASGALPEGFPPIEIDGQWYWDGGLVSNTPLQYVIDQRLPEDLCIFQVDLFSAKGEMPKDLLEVMRRKDDIRYSSRTRLNTDLFRQNQKVRVIVNELLEKLPADALSAEDKALLTQWSQHNSVTIAHLIYRQKDYEQHSKDYEFSRLSVNEHWESGVNDVHFTLAQSNWKNRQKGQTGVHVFDFDRGHGSAAAATPSSHMAR
ncbi:patatin-like phospholipase family protein [Limnobacter sp.]|uniref:patatin-like phospholipase family protein n=1 Tax=Limnobacter sp. TaxID=2003368 RepID=UPI00258CD6D3|nr:patatin-like phospholipase family protein [Limnobacter sp.]